MKTFLQKINPAVKKHWLQLIAGLIWSAVGIMLVSFAVRWILNLQALPILEISFSGLLLGSAIYFFGFSRLARKNISRINGFLKDRICVFAFQRWSSYPLVVFMIFLGIFLRLHTSIPKPILAILYLGIGVGLFTSSLLYYPQVFNQLGPVRKRL